MVLDWEVGSMKLLFTEVWTDRGAVSLGKKILESTLDLLGLKVLWCIPVEMTNESLAAWT